MYRVLNKCYCCWC